MTTTTNNLPGPATRATPRRGPESTNLADLLERVLDKGVIIAGDIQVNLLEIELLTIRIRLLVASVDKAEEMGIDWWRNDPMLNSNAKQLADENRELRSRLDALEQRRTGTEADREAAADTGSPAEREATDG